jgi:predicted regulator of amino acid metabolism with ACT domain
MLKVSKKVKIMMIDKELTGADIARKAGVDRSAINHVIANRSKSPRLRKIIAESLNASVEELWPPESSDL